MNDLKISLGPFLYGWFLFLFPVLPSGASPGEILRYEVPSQAYETAKHQAGGTDLIRFSRGPDGLVPTYRGEWEEGGTGFSLLVDGDGFVRSLGRKVEMEECPGPVRSAMDQFLPIDGTIEVEMVLTVNYDVSVEVDGDEIEAIANADGQGVLVEDGSDVNDIDDGESETQVIPRDLPEGVLKSLRHHSGDAVFDFIEREMTEEGFKFEAEWPGEDGQTETAVVDGCGHLLMIEMALEEEQLPLSVGRSFSRLVPEGEPVHERFLPVHFVVRVMTGDVAGSVSVDPRGLILEQENLELFVNVGEAPFLEASDCQEEVVRWKPVAFRSMANPSEAYVSWADESELPIGQEGWAEDADLDGWANGLEYAFSSNPISPAERPEGFLEPGSGGIVLRYFLPVEPAGNLVFRIESSSDLQSWRSDAPGIVVEGEQRFLQRVFPVDDEPRQFFRLQVLAD